MRRVIDWLKKWGLAIAGVLFAILTLGLIAQSQRGRLGKVKDELQLERALTRNRELRAQRVILQENLDEKDEASQAVDRQLAENHQEILDAHEGGEDLTDDELEEELKRLLGT